MDQDTVLLITFWVATGAFIGGVVTPVLVANRKFNDWLAMLIGVGVGAVGNVALLLPLWLLLLPVGRRESTLLPWQRDAISSEEVLADLARVEQGVSPLQVLTQNFWPAPRADGAHSHRLSYLGVFVALAALTAVEVTLTYLDLSFSITAPLVVLSAAKVMLVVMYFMHLRFDNTWYSAIFASSLPFAGIVMVVLAVA
jgi:heme/copper-type cytochrome/quinol oxidase subunit 4